MNEKRVERLASKVASLPTVLSQGKMLGGFRIEELPTGEVRGHYGLSYGYETFPSMVEAKNKLLLWLDKKAEEGKRTTFQAETLYRILARL